MAESTAGFDENLRARVIAFEKANGLPADGAVDRETWQKLVTQAMKAGTTTRSTTAAQSGGTTSTTTTTTTTTTAASSSGGTSGGGGGSGGGDGGDGGPGRRGPQGHYTDADEASGGGSGSYTNMSVRRGSNQADPFGGGPRRAALPEEWRHDDGPYGPWNHAPDSSDSDSTDGDSD